MRGYRAADSTSRYHRSQTTVWLRYEAFSARTILGPPLSYGGRLSSGATGGHRQSSGASIRCAVRARQGSLRGLPGQSHLQGPVHPPSRRLLR